MNTTPFPYFLFTALLAVIIFTTVISSQSFAEQKEIPMVGKFWENDKEIKKTYRIPYHLTNGTIVYFYGTYSPSWTGFLAEIDFDKAGGMFEFELPRNYPYKNSEQGGVAMYATINNEMMFAEQFMTQNECFYKFSIPSVNYTKIEISLNYVLTPTLPIPNYGDKVPQHCIPKTMMKEYRHNPFIDPPYEQLRDGKSMEDIRCMIPLSLFIKEETQKPLCLKKETFEDLVDRGYFPNCKDTVRFNNEPVCVEN